MDEAGIELDDLRSELQVLYDIYPGSPIEPTTAVVARWARCLDGIPARFVRAAFAELTDTDEYRPTPATVRRTAETLAAPEYDRRRRANYFALRVSAYAAAHREGDENKIRENFTPEEVANLHSAARARGLL